MMTKTEAIPEELSSLSYEAAVQMLEQTVTRLESGDISLEESMALFRQGMTLSEICAGKLAEIEKQITQLIEKSDGTIEEKEFAEQP